MIKCIRKFLMGLFQSEKPTQQAEEISDADLSFSNNIAKSKKMGSHIAPDESAAVRNLVAGPEAKKIELSPHIALSEPAAVGNVGADPEAKNIELNPVKAFSENATLRNIDVDLQSKHNEASTKSSLKNAELKNPYLQSKALWNDMYGDVQTKLENSYRIIFILSAVIAIAIVGFIIIANQVKVKALPFVIHGDEVVTLNLDDAPNSSMLQTQLASYFVKQFVRNARSVSIDAQINRAQEIAAYSFVSGAATQTLSDFYEKNNPNEIASNHVKSVHVTSVLRASAHTFDIRWDEELRKVDTGEVVQTQHFIAQITYQYQKPSADAVVLRSNPMGFQITQLTWSEDIQS